MNTLIIFCAKYLVYVAIAIAIFFLLKQSRQKQKEILIFAVILLPLSYAIAKIAGYFYFNPRPFVVGNFTPLFPHAPDNGFPSDHTLLAAVIALTTFHFSRKTGLLLFVLSLIIGFARVLAGVHHVFDIVGSIAIASAVYLVVHYFLFSRILKYNEIK